MAAAAPALLIASTAMSAIGSIQQGNATASAARYNEAIEYRNATISRQQARAEADQKRKESLKQLGAARAGYAASGVTMDGSPLDVLASSASEAELDRQNILYRGELAALGYEDSAYLYGQRASNARTAGYMGAASALLSGAYTFSDRQADRQPQRQPKE